MTTELNNSPQVSDTQWVFCKEPAERSHTERTGDAEHSAWYRAQQAVRKWLSGKDIVANSAGYYDPYDLITSDGVRIEVKASGMVLGPSRKGKGTPYWTFNIHRHGILNEDQVDSYILRCEMPTGLRPFFGKNAIHLIVPAPIGIKTLAITPRALLTRWAHSFNNFNNLARRSK